MSWPLKIYKLFAKNNYINFSLYLNKKIAEHLGFRKKKCFTDILYWDFCNLFTLSIFSVIEINIVLVQKNATEYRIKKKKDEAYLKML